MDDLSLVWEGGGAKGAFGVKFLYNLKNFYPNLNFKNLIGSSVGGINIVSLTFGDYEILFSLWERIKEIEGFIFREEGIRFNTYGFLINLIKFLYEYNILEKVKKSNTNLYIVSKIKSGKVLIFSNKEIESKGEILIKKIETIDDLIYAILGTSAIPKFFPSVKYKVFDKLETLLDGGVIYTFPIEPLLVLGATEKIVGIIHEPYDSFYVSPLKIFKSISLYLMEKYVKGLTKKNLSKFKRVSENIFEFENFKLFLIYPKEELPSALDFSKDSIIKSFSLADNLFSKIKKNLIDFIETP